MFNIHLDMVRAKGSAYYNKCEMPNAKLQQEVDMSSNELVQARNQIKY
jgi:hypothetical protein